MFDPNDFLNKTPSKNKPNGFNPDSFVAGTYTAGKKPQIINEMHPDISLTNRTIAKSLSPNNTVTAKWLQKKYPNLNIKEEQGKILIKRKNENNYRLLDPVGITSVKELAADTLDLVQPALSTIGVTLAGKAGALGGAAAGLPVAGVGAVPGALAGGAAAIGGFNAAETALTNFLQKQVGMDVDSVTAKDLAQAASVGAAAGLVFGPAKNVKGLAAPAFKALYRGAKNKVLAPATGFLTGKSSDTIRNVAKNFDEIKRLEKGYLDKTVKEVADKTRSAIKSTKSRIWGLQDKVLDNINEIDLKPIRDKLAVAAREQRLMATTPKQVEQVFKPIRKQLGDKKVITGVEAQRIKRVLNKLGKQSRSADPLKQEVGNIANEMSTSLNSAIASQNPRYSALNKMYSSVKSTEDLFNKEIFRHTPGTTFSYDAAKSSLEELAKGDATRQIVGKKFMEMGAYGYNPKPALQLLDAYKAVGGTQTPQGLAYVGDIARAGFPVALGAAGGYVGRMLGGTPGLIIGAGAGAALGGRLGGPGGLRGIMQAGRAADRAATAVGTQMASPYVYMPLINQQIQNDRGF